MSLTFTWSMLPKSNSFLHTHFKNLKFHVLRAGWYRKPFLFPQITFNWLDVNWTNFNWLESINLIKTEPNLIDLNQPELIPFGISSDSVCFKIMTKTEFFTKVKFIWISYFPKSWIVSDPLRGHAKLVNFLMSSDETCRLETSYVSDSLISQDEKQTLYSLIPLHCMFKLCWLGTLQNNINNAIAKTTKTQKFVHSRHLAIQEVSLFFREPNFGIHFHLTLSKW